MLRRSLICFALVGSASLAACTQALPSTNTAPTPVALSGQPGGIQVQPQHPAPQAMPPAPAAPLAGAPGAQPTLPPSFASGAEAARAKVVEPPKDAKGIPQSETRPTTVPSTVKPLGPTTISTDKMLYVRGGHLWVAQADGKDKKRLLPEGAPQLWSPPKDPGRAWVSPSGKNIVYFGGPSGGVWVTDIEGKNNRLVLERAVPTLESMSAKEAEKVGRKLMEQEPSWSPDETQLAILAAPTGQIDLYLANFKTNQAVQVNNDPAIHDAMVWSPKGDMLAFKSRDEVANIERAFVVRGNQLVVIPTQAIANAINETDLGGVLTLTWFDDTRLFFYPVSQTLQSLGIWFFDTTTASLNPLYREPLTNPDYSTVTRRWTFSDTTERKSLYVLDSNGNAKPIVPSGALAPIWAPDGKRVIYSVDNGEFYDAHIVNDDGTGDKTLAKNVNFIGDNPPEPGPAGKRYFTPDGKHLVFAAAGADYGTTGDNLENWWAVPLDGSSEPGAMTDIGRIFYIRQLSYSPDKASYAFTGLSYRDRSVHLWTFSRNGGGINKIDADVRWFRWIGPSTSAKGN